MAPNILLLMTDQQRADCLSCARHPIVKTPNIDRLAAEGVRFSRTYTPSPLCMPARSSFLSGLYCHNHHQWDNKGTFGSTLPTYPRALQRLGYHTCQIGKAHMYQWRGHHLDKMKPYMHDLGWDEVFETSGPFGMLSAESILTDHWRTIGCLDTLRQDYLKRFQAGVTAAWPSPLPPGENLDDFVGRLAMDYLSRYNHDEPFLVFVGFGGPHDPWDPPRAWAAQYDPAAMDPAKPITTPGLWVPKPAAEHQGKLQNEALGLTPESIAGMRAHYYAKISHIDSWIGRILDTLTQRNILDKTMIIFCSDHGEMLGDKGRVHKSVFYEEAVHVPLIIRSSSYQRPGTIYDGLTSLVDVYPTLLDLAESAATYRGLGNSLLPVLKDPYRANHERVCSEIDFRTMMFDGRYKLVIDNATAAVLKLYDLQEDPDEAINLVGQDGTQDLIAHLKDRLLTWHLSTQVRKPVEEETQLFLKRRRP